MKIILLFLFLFAVVCHGQDVNTLDTLYEWKYIEYEWESENQKQDAISSGDYNMSASVPVDVDIAFETKVFVTIIRTAGVPATLGIVLNETGDGGPLVRPYPNWEMNQAKNCEGLLNVYRIDIDRCNNMWILDSGMVDDEYKCPAKLVVVDLINDTVINTMEIDRDLYKAKLTNIIVYHNEDSCMYPTVLMSDTDGDAIVIHDGRQFCRFESKYFKPYISASTYTIDGESFTKPYGLIAMAITERTDHNLEEAAPIFQFRVLSSHYMYWTLLDGLASYCDTKVPPLINRYHYDIPSQTVVFTVANRIMFYTGINTTSLRCYNTMKHYNKNTDVTLFEDKDRLQWVSGMKSYPKSLDWAQSIIMLSNRYLKVMLHTINNDEVNYRILSGIADELTYETNCY